MLTQLIAYQITKKAHENKAKLRVRDKVLPNDSDVASELFEQLRDLFQ